MVVLEVIPVVKCLSLASCCKEGFQSHCLFKFWECLGHVRVPVDVLPWCWYKLQAEGEEGLEVGVGFLFSCEVMEHHVGGSVEVELRVHGCKVVSGVMSCCFGD